MIRIRRICPDPAILISGIVLIIHKQIKQKVLWNI